MTCQLQTALHINAIVCFHLPKIVIFAHNQGGFSDNRRAMMRDDLNNMDITAIARQTRDALAAEHGELEAGAMSWIILEHLTGQRRGRLMVRGDLRLNGTQQNSLNQIVAGLRASKPPQSVLGTTKFYS